MTVQSTPQTVRIFTHDAESLGTRDYTGYVEIDSNKAIGEGGFASVQHGRWTHTPEEFEQATLPEIAIKSIRFIPHELPPEKVAKVCKRLAREIELWGGATNDHVLPLLGFAYITDNSPLPSLISPFMPNGSVTEYLEQNPSADRLKLMTGIALGVQYLHCVTFAAHGDIKPDNVVVDQNGEALLCDFGLARVQAEGIPQGVTSNEACTFRYSPPEILEADMRAATSACDIYALGMTFYHIMTGVEPFQPEYRNDWAVFIAVTGENERPKRPITFVQSEINEVHWELWTRCWCKEPKDRLPIDMVVTTLFNIAGHISSPTTLTAATLATTLSDLAGRISPPTTPTSITSRSILTRSKINLSKVLKRLKPAVEN